MSALALRHNIKPRQFRLTARQMETLALLAQGLPTKLIARRLNISNGTVKVHVSAILREFGVANRLQAVLAAQTCGCLDNHQDCATASADCTPLD
jgi:DNA-binding NarL/FixJ family response regulator